MCLISIERYVREGAFMSFMGILFIPTERFHTFLYKLSTYRLSWAQAKEDLEPSQLRLPIAPMPKLPAKQALLPQENPFDINSELIPNQEKEVEVVFNAPELDDFLLPPANNPLAHLNL